MDHINFMKNMAPLGALLFVAVQPEPCPWHVDLHRHQSASGGALVPVIQPGEQP